MSKSSLSERATPRTDAWVDRLRSKISPTHGGEYGQQSELARYLCALHGNDSPCHSDLTRWVSQFSRWFRRTGLPGLEDYFRIEEWLKTGGRTTKVKRPKTSVSH